MDLEAMSGREEADAGLSWTAGKVAEMLGVSPVTLRTWSARYGVGPTLRGDGRHRRYSNADVRRLQHMRRLIDRGVRAREAAAAAFTGSSGPASEVSLDSRIAEIEHAAESLGFPVLATLLTETLDAAGPVSTWNDILVPILDTLGRRWLRGEACFESEWALTSEISLALERFCAQFADPMPGRVVLLTGCPDERHTLPMEVLRAALAEAGIPVRFLGARVPAETIVAMAAKLDPALVVVWSRSAGTVDDLVRRRIEQGGADVAVAGPGWADLSSRGRSWVNSLDEAIDLVVDHLRT
ncbi:MerR family transcriptional regulator [Amycolatopsis saalfeldensis]|uniref:MerR family transcriptional regulator n=1 Tax=Amycolatopsis saalfeldensis TaxID=394193 RepID=UPI000B85B864|nr:MerR family transcriptional regulator [Amycolatopsis saalfeldensis]